LDDLTSRYQSIAEKAHRSAELASNDLIHIQELEKEIEEAVRLWQYQKNAYSSNTQATANIQRLLGDIARDLDTIKRQYKQGMKSYSQIDQDLIGLSIRSSNASILIDNDQTININGEINMHHI